MRYPLILFFQILILWAACKINAQPFSFIDKETGQHNLKLGYDYKDILRDENYPISSDVYSGTAFLNADYQTGSGLISFNYRRSENFIRTTNFKSDFDFFLGSNSNTINLSYTKNFGFAAAEFKAGALEAYDNWGVEYQLKTQFYLNLKLLHSISFSFFNRIYPFQIETRYNTDFLSAAHFLKFRGVATGLNFIPAHNSNLKVEYSFSLPGESNLPGKFSAHDNTTINLWYINYQHLFHDFIFSAEYYNLSGTSEITLLSNNASFSVTKLPDIYLNFASTNFTYRWRKNSTSNISLDYFYLRSKIIGSLQSFPFTSVLQSFILNRIYYRVFANLSIFNITASNEWKFDWLIIEPELSFMDISPDLIIESWQPAYLVFGVSDFYSNRLKIKRIGIGKLGLDLTFPVSDNKIEISLNQYFPVYVSYHPKEQIPPTTPDVQVEPKTRGGFFMNCTLFIVL
ncbi:MAG: hypothetical protein K9H48_10085 [Melioribacteraceae bacterium]|nr:hypothetical protein [Melioribacteraceae bacterium]MCF8393316.1 hypothetical protein [Melioribacteraceae bacterium]MCF8419168.1 hypothetical protein [Melioribacteraceae bacterium]